MDYAELLWYAFCGIVVSVIAVRACLTFDKISDKLDRVIEKFEETGEKQ